MSFYGMSMWSAWAGLVGIAVLLYILQNLRSRPRDIPVVTTLFWRDAIHQAPARRFRRRFQHLSAYLLALAICSLMWLGLAQLRVGEPSTRDYVFLLDGSAHLARGDDFERTVSELVSDVSRAPRDSRKVLWVGSTTAMLLAPGEHQLLLQRRVAGRLPEATPGSLERQVRQLAATGIDNPTTILVYGGAPLHQEVVDMLPASIEVVWSSRPAPAMGNTGITNLGASAASSGAWGSVDVLVDIQSDYRESIRPNEFSITLDGEPLERMDLTATAGGRFLLQEVPARGGLLEVRLLEPDTLPLDDVARLRLPDRQLLKVHLSPSLSPVLAAALAADPAVGLSAPPADIVVQRDGEDRGSAMTPTLEFVPATRQQAALVLHDGEREMQTVSLQAMQTLGLPLIDVYSTARPERGSEQTVARSNRPRSLSVREELLDPDNSFVQSRNFPLFLARSLRWLASLDAWYPYAAAGQPLVESGQAEPYRFVNRKGAELDTLGAEFAPVRAGDLFFAESHDDAKTGRSPLHALPVSLLDTAVTLGAARTSISPSSVSARRSSTARPTFPRLQPELVPWLLPLALALLAAEWVLYRAQRIP